MTDLDTDATPTANILSYSVTALTVKEKCTWVAYAVLVPPAFALGKAVGSTVTAGYDLDNDYWVVHHMEYSELGGNFGQ